MPEPQQNQANDEARLRPVPRLSIPTHPEAAADYKIRLGMLLGSSRTHVYIDTSFLMWSTKIGPAARGQLLQWLRDNLQGRVHVPTWSAHEYLRHHVAGTIVDELIKRSGAVAQVAGSTFAYFRPFLDDPALPAAEGWDGLRASTREAVNSLGRLAEAAKGWRRAYPAHAEQIIAFINERVLEAGGVFEDLSSISAQGAARYEGRIPPGYQDRNKRGDGGEDDPDEAGVAGANRYGDLIFWKEALAHAKEAGATAMVILTNDRKNDWRMGAESGAALDEIMLAQKKAWRPVPRIHPMLALEAKLVGAQEVALVDSQYLAAYLSGIDPNRVDAFADVAIVPDPPAKQSEGERRAFALNHRLAEDAARDDAVAAESSALAAEDGFRFPDDPSVKSSVVALKRALLESRNGANARGAAIIDRVRGDIEGAQPFDAVLTAETLAGMDHIALVSMARGLHDDVLAGRPGLAEPMVDLVGLLEELPTFTAGALLLGLIASMYLCEGTGNSRLPPKSPASAQLFSALEQPYADVCAKVIRQRLASNTRQPLYAPGDGLVECVFDVEVETMERDELRSLKIAGIETLTAAQEADHLRLRAIMSAEVTTGGAILEQAARLFTLPPELLDAVGDDVTEYTLTETVGFRSPEQVSHNREEP